MNIACCLCSRGSTGIDNQATIQRCLQAVVASNVAVRFKGDRCTWAAFIQLRDERNEQKQYSKKKLQAVQMETRTTFFEDVVLIKHQLGFLAAMHRY